MVFFYFRLRIKSVVQVSDGIVFVLHGVVGCESYDGVRERGFSEYGGSQACGSSAYRKAWVVYFVVIFCFCREPKFDV